MESYEIKNEIDRIFSESDGEPVTFKTIPTKAVKKLGSLLALAASVALDAVVEGVIEVAKRKIKK